MVPLQVGALDDIESKFGVTKARLLETHGVVVEGSREVKVSVLYEVIRLLAARDVWVVTSALLASRAVFVVH